MTSVRSASIGCAPVRARVPCTVQRIGRAASVAVAATVATSGLSVVAALAGGIIAGAQPCRMNHEPDEPEPDEPPQSVAVDAPRPAGDARIDR